MEAIFHEKQEGSLCAQHCLNALLQAPYFTAVELATLASQIDDQERSQMAEGGVQSEDYRKFLQQPSGNVDDSGYFSVQVIAYALKVWALDLIPYNSQNPLAELTRRDPTKRSAYICNFRDHWLTIRKIGNQWFNLNSLLVGPELVSDTYLSLFLAQLIEEGYSIFIVDGKLPDSTADKLLRLKPAVQRVKPSLISDLKVPFGLGLEEEMNEKALNDTLNKTLAESLQMENACLQAALSMSLNEFQTASSSKTFTEPTSLERQLPISPDLGFNHYIEESFKRRNTAGDTPKLSLKKKRQSLYSQCGRKDIALRVTCKNDSKNMTPPDAAYITSASVDFMLEDAGAVTPQVERSTLHPDGLYIVCRDQPTMDWLKKFINELPPPKDEVDHPGYLALGPGDRPPFKRFCVWFPGNRDARKNIKLLEVCNDGFDARKVAVKAIIPGDRGNTLVLNMDTEMVRLLESRDFRLHCGMGSVFFKEAVTKKPVAAEVSPRKVEASLSDEVENTSGIDEADYTFGSDDADYTEFEIASSSRNFAESASLEQQFPISPDLEMSEQEMLEAAIKMSMETS